MPEPVIACSLSAADQAERLQAAADLRERALLEVESIPAGLRLRFVAEPGIREELDQLIEAESKCCSFLSFELDSRGRELILEIRGPDQARPLISELFGLQVAAG
jgi:hypothetical protein